MEKHKRSKKEAENSVTPKPRRSVIRGRRTFGRESGFVNELLSSNEKIEEFSEVDVISTEPKSSDRDQNDQP